MCVCWGKGGIASGYMGRLGRFRGTGSGQAGAVTPPFRCPSFSPPPPPPPQPATRSGLEACDKRVDEAAASLGHTADTLRAELTEAAEVGGRRVCGGGGGAGGRVVRC